MTAQILAAELGNLIQDSKRKNTELRNAADKALQELKALSVTSEAQLSADLSRRPHFISPFLIACSTRNAKFGSTGVSCLQRLSVSRALPKERLAEVLDALKDSVSLSHDVQLKILQALPSLVQNYPLEIHGDLLSTILQICSALQNAKNFAVSNTAAATLQQIVIAVFDRVTVEDEKSLEIPTVAEVPGDEGNVPVRLAAHDAYKVFYDINLLVTGEKPNFVRFSSLPPTSTLEMIEAVLANHGRIMTTHQEQIYVLRTLLMPTIIRSLSDRLSFPVTLRIIRILNLLIRNHLSIMPSECEIALGLLNHMLDPEASTAWKRALCLEVFRGIYSESRLLLQIYSLYDEQEGKKNIFGDNLASFVRLATEKPALIGLGQQSTMPMSRSGGSDESSEQAVAEAGALAGVIGGSVTEATTVQTSGISLQWSTLKTPCIEHLDKSEPPAMPETYIYGLVLTCITNVSESLAKFVLPLTVHQESRSRKRTKVEDDQKREPGSSPSVPSPRRLSRTQSFRKKTIPVNPLTLEEHPAFKYVQTSATLVTDCWPAVMATCSTFLNASLDADYYRALVRAIQKFTQVAGLLRLSTPRDAFLTTLGKAAVPSTMLLANVSSPKSPAPEHSGVFGNAKGLLSVDSFVSQASSTLDKNRHSSHEINVPDLGPRNLLCLRALLNLAIALGPTLQSAWSIVFETLQVADLVMALSNQHGLRTPGSSKTYAESDTSTEKVGAETSAVQAAARRLFESTVDFPNESFMEVLQALCALIQTSSGNQSGNRTPNDLARPQILHQRRVGSISGMNLSTETNSRDSAFALNKIGELAALNEERLAHYEPSESGWDILVAELVRFSADGAKATSSRLLAADTLSRTVKEIAKLSVSDEERNFVQARILLALQTQIAALHHGSEDGRLYSDTDVRIHQITLESLKSVIEQCGESLVAGWVSVLDSLLSVFAEPSSLEKGEPTDAPADELASSTEPPEVISRALARTAFGTVQLVCSDFMAAVPVNCLATLLELLLRFSRQQDDLNMSLTAVTFFWNVSDFLHSYSNLSRLPDIVEAIKDRQQVRQLVREKSQEGTTGALWLQVLLNLSVITTDRRAELRNSAIQTIQRIFENYVDQITSKAWMACLRSVLFGMIESNLAVQKRIHGESGVSGDDIAAWNETTKTVLDSVSALISLYLDKVDDASKLSPAWSDLLDLLQEYFPCGSHALGASVFATITTVFSRIEDSQVLGSMPLLKTAAVWRRYFDHGELWRNNGENNQEAFVMYADAFKAIYCLAAQHLNNEDLTSMLANLRECIIVSDEVPYSSDLDHMTPLQTRVLDCYTSVRSEGLADFLIRTLSSFAVLPYSADSERLGKRGPTFVALSKASMDLLQTIVIKHMAEETIYTSGAFLYAMTSLVQPLRGKYIWKLEGKPPAIWQKATTAGLAILEASLQSVNQLEGEQLRKIWEQIVNLAHGITHAEPSTTSPPSDLHKDEHFDVESYTKLRELITLPLGSTSLADSLRRKYTRNLFETSIVHYPSPGEIPDLEGSPLEDLYKVRLGRTDEPTTSRRSAMAYVCFAELVALVSSHDSSTERIKLAQAAAPYLILRAALPLRMYVADHPLRGRMPQPESQRQELLLILEELAKLKSEPASIPDAPGVRSKQRKHLHRLYPLLIKAMRVARNDPEVFEALANLTEMVGLEFGVLEE